MASAYAKRLAASAEKDFNDYHTFDETTAVMAARIRKYWQSLGKPFPGVSTPWSAVFVSHHVRSAGATSAEFKFAAAHSVFVHKAAANAQSGTGVFRAHALADHAPQIGDIIQNNRLGNTFDYAHARTHQHYFSHSAIVVEEGVDGSGRYVRTIGGNEGNRVGERVVRLNSQGFIKQPGSTPRYYICVIETLK